MKVNFATIATVVVAAAGAGGVVAVALAQTAQPQPAPIAPGPGLNPGDGAVDAAAGGGLKPCPADKSANFDTYSLGATFEGQRRGQVERACQPPDPTARAMSAPALRDNHAGYNYGTCTVPPEDEASCPYPIAVQNFPACERNLSLYRRYAAPDGQTYPFDETTIRGVPAAVFDSGLRVEVYTGDVTVVIWGTEAGAVRRAASRLQGLHRGRPVSVSQDLPAPDPGAQQGKLAC